MPTPETEMVPSDYILPEHTAALAYYFPDQREQSIRVAAARDLLPHKPDLLPGMVAHLMRELTIELMAGFPDEAPEDMLALAEAIVLFALLARAKGVPVTPRQS